MNLDVSKCFIRYLNPAKSLKTDLRASDVYVHDQKLKTTFLCGISSKFEPLKFLIDAVADGETGIRMCNKWFRQEQQQLSDREMASKYVTDSV